MDNSIQLYRWMLIVGDFMVNDGMMNGCYGDFHVDSW